ncbi:MAG: saccharopine dehydrogenase NADP-binding domain-containing protein [Bacteroidales bacterium]|nr:saccharopine dehydrogenase NADP-binding domain-containing protein [Bacteroidales bacterium]
MNKKNVLVLGAGLVGRPMALDLAANDEFGVGIVDISAERLALFANSRVKTHQLDLSDAHALKSITNRYDLFINAVPGFMGFETLIRLIEQQKPVVDIAFYPEDVFGLTELALKHNTCVICDMGVAPGMSHLLTGYAASQLNHVQKALIYVGGLPKLRSFPWEYKAVFSPADVIEEYTRPARLVENGKIVIKEALSEAELIDFEHIGTLEAFNSDGLRSLAYTIKADYMAEKTLRYPGHIEKIKVLKQSGFFSLDPVEINGTKISPLAFTKQLLFPAWQLQPGEEDITVMKIMVEGITAEGKKKRFEYFLYDEYSQQTGIHSMARTTGYSATVALRMIAQGVFTTPGIHVPEIVGKDTRCVEFMLNGLKARGVVYHEKVTDLCC